MRIGALIKAISLAFAGKYVVENEEIKKMKKDIFDLEIPTVQKDKINLNND